jgi:hypothetical protein
VRIDDRSHRGQRRVGALGAVIRKQDVHWCSSLQAAVSTFVRNS